MDNSTWTQTLRPLYDKALSLYRDGKTGAETFFNPEETALLATIGLKPINVYDYVEDFLDGGDPDWDTFLLVAAARRDYFLYEQKGKPVDRITEENELPPKDAELGGIRWLPRIICKAKCFLEGGLCHEIMYGCGGDRNFLRKHKLHSADFLREVWASHGNNEKVLAFVQKSAAE
jgi:hypothetical protein